MTPSPKRRVSEEKKIPLKQKVKNRKEDRKKHLRHRSRQAQQVQQGAAFCSKSFSKTFLTFSSLIRLTDASFELFFVLMTFGGRTEFHRIEFDTRIEVLFGEVLHSIAARARSSN